MSEPDKVGEEGDIIDSLKDGEVFEAEVTRVEPFWCFC